MTRIALVGEHDPEITAHVAISQALASAREVLGVQLEWEWISTAAPLAPGFDGIWVVPGSRRDGFSCSVAATGFDYSACQPLAAH